MSDFQEHEVSRVAQDIYDLTTNVITKAIIERLGIEDVYTDQDEEGNIVQLPVEFKRAFDLLRESGQMVTHEFVLEENKPVMKIAFYKIDSQKTYDVKSIYEISINERN